MCCGCHKLVALSPTMTNLLLLVGASFTSDVVESGRPQAPPDKAFDIIKCGREIQNGIPVPVIAKGELATPELRVLGQRERSASLMSCNWSGECG